jgi:MFS family permease
VLSVMLLAQQGGMPLGHLLAGFLTHYISPPWVLRWMFGALIVATAIFLWMREPGIDNLPRRKLGKLSFLSNLWEAITAHSHHPNYPAEIAVEAANRG